MSDSRDTRKSRKCSLDPQRVIKDQLWYYEYPGKLEFHANMNCYGTTETHKHIFVFRLSRRKLAASLKRMNASRRKGGS